MNSIPVLIKNVDLEIQLQTNSLEEQAKLQAQLEIINRIKAKFGEDVLIEQLSTLLCGTISKVTISRQDMAAPVPFVPPFEPPRYNSPTDHPPQPTSWYGTPVQHGGYVAPTYAPPPPLPQAARSLGVTQGQPTAYPYTHMMQSDKFRGKQIAYIKAEDLFGELDYAPWALTDEDKSAINELRRINSAGRSNINAGQIPYENDDILF